MVSACAVLVAASAPPVTAAAAAAKATAFLFECDVVMVRNLL